jgi:hypothetical protein
MADGNGKTVILRSIAERCVSKDGCESGRCCYPSRLAKGLAPQDDGEAVTASETYSLRSFTLAPAPPIGIWFTASTTAKVMISIEIPSTEIAARSPLSLRS